MLPGEIALTSAPPTPWSGWVTNGPLSHRSCGVSGVVVVVTVDPEQLAGKVGSGCGLPAGWMSVRHWHA